MASDTAIMESLDPFLHDEQDGGSFVTMEKSVYINPMLGSVSSKNSLPDVLTNELVSLNLVGTADRRSVLLLDQDEVLALMTEMAFCERLGCDPATNIKVVSILGNTGEGKSHTLNETFFGGEEVFATSSQQESCTTGVWAGFDPSLSLVLLDTEGMLGLASNENIRTRLLLKVLAVSDVVIYRTRAERLHNDLFYFLGDASKAYNKHFRQELDLVCDENKFTNSRQDADVACSLGPTIVIFHETRHTDPLPGPDPEGSIRDRFKAMNQDMSAFSKIRYIGTKTGLAGCTDFGLLRGHIEREVADSTVRSQRKITHVYQAFMRLNKKFSGQVLESGHRSFPDEYFTCAASCQSCKARCSKQMKHAGDHASDPTAKCSYSVQFENKVYSCRRCQENGRRCVVVPKASSSKEGAWIGLAKFAWSGFVLECQKCGVIYRSRQQWFGNMDPESQGVVHTSLAHVWPGVRSLQGTQNAARRLLDGVTALSGSVSEVSSAPAATFSRWAADQVAPAYWRPNSEIVHCHNCKENFTVTGKIHHCRSCGEGFCTRCSNYKRPVPEKGWGYQPVRVCKLCYMITPGDGEVLDTSRVQTEPSEINARKAGETVLGTMTSLASALELPITVIKDSARPEYWVPDHEISACSVCDTELGTVRAYVSQESRSVHHCRQCGKGVCNGCSQTRRPVPSRGWDNPVRVCDDCIMLPDI